MWDGAPENESPGLREVVRSIMAEAGQAPAAGIDPGMMEGVTATDPMLRDIVPGLMARHVDLWGSNQPKPAGRSLWDRFKDYLKYAESHAY